MIPGCFNNNVGDSGGTALTDGSGGKKGNNPFYNGGGTSGTGGGAHSTLARLDRVVFTPGDPLGSFDLLGSSGTSALGELCATSGSGNDPEANTPCRCEYTLEGTSTTIPVNTVYVENNLIRCPRTLIPADTPAVHVRIQFMSFGEFSNSVRVSLGSINTGLDLTKVSSFVPIQRMQCRDYIYIPYMFGGGSSEGMYDPFQSDSSLLSYPLNYFTSNPGGTVLARLASGAGQSLWECSMNAATPLAWENLAVWSDTPDPTKRLCEDLTTGELSVVTGACGAGKRLLISNPKIFVNRTTSTGNNWDRANFLLARKPTGVFNQPINAFVAPFIPTVVLSDESERDTSQPEPLGYAARPIPNTSGGEDCPTDTPIPEGYHWAKLFAWRGGVPSRQYVMTSTEVQRTGGIVCDPGNWPSLTPSGKHVSVAEDCAKAWPPSATADTGSRFPLSDSGSVAARILGNSKMCVLPTTCVAGPNGCEPLIPPPGLAGQAYAVNDTAFPKGADLWSRVGAHAAFEITPDNFVWVDLGSVGSVAVPVDDELVYRNLDTPNGGGTAGTSREDFMFTVAPVGIKAYDDILDGTLSDVGKFFAPVRTLSVDDCRTDDTGKRPDEIDGPSEGWDNDFKYCRQSRILRYGIYDDDITEGDNPGKIYPFCVIQKD